MAITHSPRRLTQLWPTAVNRVLQDARQLQAQGRSVISLMRGQPDSPTPEHIVEAAQRALCDGRTGYADNQGEPSLREAVAAKIAREHGASYDPGREILVTDGATLGVYAALGALVDTGTPMLLPDPIYDAYQAPIALWGGCPMPVAATVRRGRFTLDQRSFENAWVADAKLILLNSPWNPVGTVLSRAELAGIMELAQAHNCTVISDEIYESLVYDDHRHVSVPSVSADARERTVIINSFSKTYAMTGWRVGYCAGPAEIIRSMLLILQQSSRGPATFVQDAAACALNSNQESVRRMATEYQVRRDRVVEWLRGIPGVMPLVPEGGLFVMVDVRGLGRPSDVVRRFLLREAGVVVLHGAAFGAGGEGFLRVSFAAGGEALERGLEPCAKGCCGSPQEHSPWTRPPRSFNANVTALPVIDQNRPATVDLRELHSALALAVSTHDVRYDRVSRALYATDASVYQIVPLLVAFPASPADVAAALEICADFGCRSRPGAAGRRRPASRLAPGVILDCSKHFGRVLEINPIERWVRVEPGCVLDELNLSVAPHGLVFAPDVSTSDRATLGGMIANNSCGARSVCYGKTIDHVLELKTALSDGSIAHLAPLTESQLEAKCDQDDREGACYRATWRLASEHAEEIDRRFPRILRRVGGYNLDEFVPGRVQGEGGFRFNLSRVLVGSEGTLGVTVEAKLKLVELPRARATLVVEFAELLEALEATPLILRHGPAAVEVVDKYVLDSTLLNPEASRLRDFLLGDPSAILLIELHDERVDLLPARLAALAGELQRQRLGYRHLAVTDTATQARVWKLRRMALGLSMAEKGDAKAISFVEDTAVAPEHLRDYIAEFLALIARFGIRAGVYAHASVGCLHVRPVVNLKSEDGVRKFAAIADEVSNLVLKYGGALSANTAMAWCAVRSRRRCMAPCCTKRSAN